LGCLIAQACGGFDPPSQTDENQTEREQAASVPPDAERLLAPGALAEAERCTTGSLILPEWVPVAGRSQNRWAESFWRWLLSVPAERNPQLNLEQDCGVGQSGPVFFVPGFSASIYTRSCKVPFGKFVFLPAISFLNDFPCPDPNFKPAPGQSLEAFLRQGAVDFVNSIKDIRVTVDGKLIDHTKYRQTTGLFKFKGDPSLTSTFDSCITGQRQDGVADGYSLMFFPFSPGKHTVVVTDISPAGKPASATFVLDVVR
jgi:hypothetical protein